MDRDPTIGALNELLQIHTSSFARYVRHASPWLRWGGEEARETLDLIAADQEQMIERVGLMILELDGIVEPADYPLEYTYYNDLSFDFMVARLIEHQRTDVAAIEPCVARLENSPRARALAEEALGAARGHLESLEELAAGGVAST